MKDRPQTPPRNPNSPAVGGWEPFVAFRSAALQSSGLSPSNPRSIVMVRALSLSAVLVVVIVLAGQAQVEQRPRGRGFFMRRRLEWRDGHIS